MFTANNLVFGQKVKGKYTIENDKIATSIYCEQSATNRNNWILTMNKNGEVIEFGKFKSLKNAIDYCNKNENDLIGSGEKMEVVETVESVETVEIQMIETDSEGQEKLITPQKFFEYIWSLENNLDVTIACNHLLDALSKMKIKVKEIVKIGYEPSTKSKVLTKYRNLLKKPHHNTVLNEVVATDNGNVTQHIAVNLLALSKEEKTQLEATRNKSNNNFNEDGNVKEVENLPDINVSEIIDTACKLLHSQNFIDVVIGLLIVTGRRGFEIATKSVNYGDISITKEMIELDDFVVGFKGIAKKRNGCENFYKFVTLIPAKIVVESFERLSKFDDYKVLVNQTNELYQNGSVRKAISRKFSDLFSDKLSSFNAYDTDGKLTNEDGSTHKSRAFYACVLQEIYSKSVNRKTVVTQLVQFNLLHDKIDETDKYLSKYDGYNFINIPDNITLTTNINHLGITTNEEIAMVKSELSKTVVNDKIMIDFEELVSKLNSDLQVKIADNLKDTNNPLESLLMVLNSGDSDFTKTSVTKNIKTILTTITAYNSDKTDVDEMVYPTYNLINKVNQKMTGKQLANKTYNDVFDGYQQSFLEFFANKGIDEDKAEKWNNLKHRKDNDIIVSILYKSIINV